MKVQEEIKGDVAIIQLKGKVIGGPDATLFHGKIHELVNGGKKRIVIDLAKVELMNSVGLGMMISALTTVNSAGGELRLANVTKGIKTLLTITQLVRIFHTYDSIEDATKSFS